MQGSHTIVIDRERNTFELSVPEGYLLCTGSFPTMTEMIANVAHFLSKHPTTSVVYIT